MGEALSMPEPTKVVNVASVPQRSPFRYPGGKTWLVPYARAWLRSRRDRVEELIEPFAGGAIIGLTAACEGLADRVTLVEMDPDIAAVWLTMLNGGGTWLAEKIAGFRLTRESVMEILSSHPGSTRDRAFATIIRNRVQRGGILAPGAGLLKEGENGKGIKSRWYPETLVKRILNIVAARDRVHFVHGDGLEYVARNAHKERVAFFVDPPYAVAGKRLYKFSDVNHSRLFRMLSGVAGDFLMTYENTDEIRHLARDFRYETRAVAMKNTHHARMTELLIGRDLHWLKPRYPSQPLFPEFGPQTPPG
jgi:DNA adenine methylase